MKQRPTDNDRQAQPVDVLMINPGSLKAVYQELGDEFSAIEMPVIAGLYATYLEQLQYTVDIIDAPALCLGTDEVAELVAKHFQARLVVLVVYGFQPSASTQNMPAALATAKAIKVRNPELKILFTGTHPAALPEATLADYPQVDYVCDREGAEAIAGLIEFLRGNSALEKVGSLWYRDQAGCIAHTLPAPLMSDLDKAMPKPAYHLLPMERYRAHNWHCFEAISNRQPYASIYTSLGCPYKCSFCCINAPFGKPTYRMWSPRSIVAQIDELVRQYGVKNIKFVDEMFVFNKQHVLGICDLLIERQYDLNIWAYARVDTVKDEYLEKLRKAGFRWLALGIESGSKFVRDGVEKGRFSSDDIIQVVRKIQQAGINVIGNYIFGLPDDTLESMQETLDLALSANCEFANFYSAMAYPGSQLYDKALDEGLRLPEDWIGYSQHSYECLPLPTQTLTSAQVLKFRDDAFHEYFSNPDYLAMVRQKFGEDVVQHIHSFNRIRIKRKLYS